jgi:hypothetical protein
MVPPPVYVGAVQLTTDCVLAYDVAVTLVGGFGTVVAGMMLFEAAEAGLVPAELVAVTVKVYVVPLVRPVTVQDVLLVVQVRPPGLDVTVYPVMAAPPLEAGAVHETVPWV